MTQENILTTAVIILFLSTVVLGFTAFTANNNLGLARAVNIKFMTEGCYIQRMENKGVVDGITLEDYNQLNN